MPRVRMSEAEREAKRKARASFSFSDAAYAKYDVKTEGYGSQEDWERVAEQVAAELGIEMEREAMRATFAQGRNPYLVILGLVAMPTSIVELTGAFRKAAMRWHPDREGGDTAMMQKVNEAYLVIKRRMGWE